MKLRKFKTGLALTLCALSVGTLFTGCGGNESIDNYEDFVKAYNETVRDNFSAEGNVAITMAMSYGEESMDLSIDAGFDFDLAGSNMHGNIDIDGSEDGIMDMDSKAEFYYIGADNMCYTRDITDGESNEWAFSSDDSITSIAGFASTQLNASSDGDCKFENKDGKITLVQPLADMFSDSNEAMESLAGAGDMFAGEDFEKAAEGKYVTTVFDAKTLNPISIKSDEISFETEMDGMDMTMGFNMDITFSDFGKIKEDSVTVPADVKENAADADELLLGEFEDECDDPNCEDEYCGTEDENSIEVEVNGEDVDAEIVDIEVPEDDVDIDFDMPDVDVPEINVPDGDILE